MPCNGPLNGWRSVEVTPSGKRGIVFRSSEGFSDRWVSVPCGKCDGCYLERARQWAVRCVHEASQWKENVFVTLTYKTEFLPKVNGVVSLVHRDWELFMKRLRKRRGGTVRYLHAGEYGSLGRPHHHAVLFNCSFPDRKFLRTTPSGCDIYTSEELSSLWVTEGREQYSLGFSSCGEVTFESASYVARYTLKKVRDPGVAVHAVSGGKGSEGKEVSRVPEYGSMSRRPGIGSAWIEKFQSDVFPWDEVIVRGGRRCKPPRFYDVRFERADPAGYAEVKRKRLARGKVDERGLNREDPRYEVKAELLRRRTADFKLRGGSL